jgi:hypothetical protein
MLGTHASSCRRTRRVLAEKDLPILSGTLLNTVDSCFSTSEGHGVRNHAVDASTVRGTAFTLKNLGSGLVLRVKPSSRFGFRPNSYMAMRNPIAHTSGPVLHEYDCTHFRRQGNESRTLRGRIG